MALAGLALSGGILVYLTDRAGTALFGVLQGQAPDFLHIFAFILISASFAKPTYNNLLVVCIGWLSLECLFEVAQHPVFSRPIAAWLLDHPFPIPLVEKAHQYFESGTFDWLDIVSFCLGSVCAYLVLSLIPRSKS